MEQHEKERLKQYRIMADTVKNWNGGKDWNVVIAVLIPVLMWQAAVFRLCGMTGGLYLLLLFYLMVLGALFVWSHCEKYVKVEGKNGKPGQYIYEFCYGTPFSLVLYYKEIGRRLRKKYIVLVISILAAFLLANSFQLRKNFWLVSGIYLEGILIMLGISELGFRLHRYVVVSRYQAILRGKKKDNPIKRKTDNNWWGKHPGVELVMIVVIIILTIGGLELRDYLLRVPEDIEVYRTVTSGFWLIWPVMMCGIFVQKEMARFFTKEEKEKIDGKKLTGAFVVVVIALIYATTFYNTYYTDKIVSRRLWQTVEYDWEDVEAYTVKKGRGVYTLQLELKMPNQTLHVISNYTICSFKHDDNFWDDYTYVAYLVEKLDNQGVPGYLEDCEEIEPDVEEYDEETVDAFAKIKEIINGK